LPSSLWPPPSVSGPKEENFSNPHPRLLIQIDLWSSRECLVTIMIVTQSVGTSQHSYVLAGVVNHTYFREVVAQSHSDDNLVPLGLVQHWETPVIWEPCDRSYQCIIIDEVDSLLLDQGVQLTYLSMHAIHIHIHNFLFVHMRVFGCQCVYKHFTVFSLSAMEKFLLFGLLCLQVFLLATAFTSSEKAALLTDDQQLADLKEEGKGMDRIRSRRGIGCGWRPGSCNSFRVKRLIILSIIVQHSGCICRAEGSDEQEDLHTKQEEQHRSVHDELLSLMELRNI
ncbi:hypothetical protein CCH79_00009586, partial [Gambusia affinis]